MHSRRSALALYIIQHLEMCQEQGPTVTAQILMTQQYPSDKWNCCLIKTGVVSTRGNLSVNNCVFSEIKYSL